MIITGITGLYGVAGTANLINSISNLTGKKVSIIDSSNLIGLDTSRAKSYVNELDKNNIEILIIKINPKDIQNEVFKNFCFDIIIYTDRTDDEKAFFTDNYSDVIRKTFSLLDKKGTAILNVDDSELIHFLEGMKYYIVTYGFNSKASITASSIGDSVSENNFMCCLQRTISAKSGNLIEPQEYMIKIQSENSDTYNVLAAASFAIVNDIDLNQLTNTNLKH